MGWDANGVTSVGLGVEAARTCVVDAITRQAPDALLAAPEATVGKDDLLVAGRNALHLVAKDVVTVGHHHLVRPAGKRVLRLNHLRRARKAH